MGLEMEYIEGQTPLDEAEKEGLLLPHITTKKELDEFEQLNIQRAVRWSLSHSFRKEEVLTEKFIKLLHRKMFEDVWDWAGTFRRSNKNIGIRWQDIPMELKVLLDDCKYWIENSTYEENEQVIRLKHRLVSIHCFPNGNGRHSRLMADLVISSIFNKPEFTWGGDTEMTSLGKVRRAYINSVRKADQGDILPLLEFARS